MSLIFGDIPDTIHSIQIIGFVKDKTTHIYDEGIIIYNNVNNILKIESKSLFIDIINDKIKIISKSNHDYWFTFDIVFSIRYNLPLILYNLPLDRTFRDALHKTVMFIDENNKKYRFFNNKNGYNPAIHIAGVMVDHQLLHDNILDVEDDFFKEVYPTLYNKNSDQFEHLSRIQLYDEKIINGKM